MTADLPPGWASTSLEQLISSGGVFSDGDWVESKDQDPHGEVRLIQLADVGVGEFRDRSNRFLTAHRSVELNCTFLAPGDILVARMPDPLGRACRFPAGLGPCVTVVDVAIVRPGHRSIDPRWLMWSINSPQCRRQIEALQSGTTRKRISRRNLATIQVMVPPLGEQGRIVAAIEEHFSRLDAAESDLAAASAKNTSLPAVLLPHFFSNDWPTRRLGEIARVGSGATPKRSEERYWAGGTIPWVVSGAINDRSITSASELITEEALSATSVKLWPAGTVLVAMYGEGKTRGKAAVLEIESTCNQACAAIDYDRSLVDGEYLLAYLNSTYEANRNLASGGVQPNLSLGVIKSMEIPIPSLEIQRTVALQAEGISQQSDIVTEACAMARQRIIALRRAILTTAFSGQLVPQDPDDQPAAVLLDRIAYSQAARLGRRKARA